MASIADELLLDFEDVNDEPDDLTPAHPFFGQNCGLHPDWDSDRDDEATMVDDSMVDDPMDSVPASIEVADDADATKARIERMQLGAVKDVRSVAGLVQNLAPVLEKINRYGRQPSADSAQVGNIEDHPEYHLLTQSNSMSTLIDGEIMLVHKFIRDHYSVRFPELERLITNPLQYAKVVAIVGNGPMDSKSIKALQTSTNNPLGATLRSVLDGPSLMIVTVEATTTKGVKMSDEQLQRILAACEMIVTLDRAKQTLTEFVQSRMNLFAPNLTALIGSLTAAQLINAAGGLTNLSKTPACNIAAWGSKKQKNAGMATNVGIRQQGFLYHSELIRGIAIDLRQKGMRILACKVVLAARVDRVHSSSDGSTGDGLRAACLERLEKLTEPPPNKGQRALPIPDDKPARKRGGRRARKAKEALAMTDLRKAQNRMAFGKEEKEVGYGLGDSTVGLGVIGQANDGRIRNVQIDHRTRARVSAKNKGWGGGTSTSTTGAAGLTTSLRAGGVTTSLDLGARGLRAAGVGSSIGTVTGTASSLAFAPAVGLELVDPKTHTDLVRKRKAEEDDRWFKGGTFTQVGAGPANPNGFTMMKKVDTGAGKMAPPPIPLSRLA